MSTAYDSSAIEVLTGLEPVRRRPGMYTQTERPNHLAQEVVDNSVDEAIAGHCSAIDVTLHADGSLSVADNGRGMPVDKHKEEGVSGVEVILTRLHAGGKFSNKNYTFSGGLHGVGVSVVNALSHKLEVTVRRDGKEYHMSYADGQKTSELKAVGKAGNKVTGSIIRFWPDAQFFDTLKFHVPRLKHVLRAKAVLCPDLYISFTHESDAKDNEEWHYEGGLKDYLKSQIEGWDYLPADPFVGHHKSEDGEVDWAIVWLPAGGEPIMESYVNLIPTTQDGTHINGFRAGLTDAMREFCEFRDLLPRGVKLAPEDIWGKSSYVFSLKMRDPQFSGQTKERLTSREAASIVQGVAKDAFSLWLNHHVADAEMIAALAIESAQERQRADKKVARKKIGTGPALPGKLADCVTQDLSRTELFLVEGDSAGGSAKQARDREFQAIMPLRGKILNTWEVDPAEVLGSQEVHDIAVALGVDPGSSNLEGLRYGKVCILADADSDGAHIATLLCALFVRHFRPLVASGRVCVAMPPLYRIDVGKEIHYALDDDEKTGILKRIESNSSRAKPIVTRFKGLGEMNPDQLRETTMDPKTRRLVQLEIQSGDSTNKLLDMLLGKKRASDRKEWLEKNGDKAEVL
ncbi:MAG: DNA topoisomerase IV subunit B [Gammaproteobacteria bacterium]|nr:DNA topoisomerase IV subunit B [Gammaproteobacteria bacterium]MDH3369812.1 DNA topoisomerase IV subunit B [Gammaproteobacteria bacterium]MDH3406742.1 DNA topoisomerase IV subunit B [Gammaproteobacteria bacterium]